MRINVFIVCILSLKYSSKASRGISIVFLIDMLMNFENLIYIYWTLEPTMKGQNHLEPFQNKTDSNAHTCFQQRK